jgi:hypothetical protein
LPRPPSIGCRRFSPSVELGDPGLARDIRSGTRGQQRKPKPKPDNPEQFKRFLDMAREVETDESPDAIDRAFDKVMGRRPKTENPPRADRTQSRRTRDAEDSQ